MVPYLIPELQPTFSPTKFALLQVCLSPVTKSDTLGVPVWELDLMKSSFLRACFPWLADCDFEEKKIWLWLFVLLELHVGLSVAPLWHLCSSSPVQRAFVVSHTQIPVFRKSIETPLPSCPLPRQQTQLKQGTGFSRRVQGCSGIAKATFSSGRGQLGLPQDSFSAFLPFSPAATSGLSKFSPSLCG